MSSCSLENKSGRTKIFIFDRYHTPTQVGSAESVWAKKFKSHSDLSENTMPYANVSTPAASFP